MIPIFFKDYFPSIHRKLNQWRNSEWLRSPGHQVLRQVKPDLRLLPENFNLTRRQEVVLNRIKMGHTLLTHGYLMDNTTPGPKIPPTCPFCNNGILTIPHIFIQCPNIEASALKNTIFPNLPPMEPREDVRIPRGRLKYIRIPESLKPIRCYMIYYFLPLSL